MIEPGTEAFMVIHRVSGGKSQSGKRSILEGAARVKVVEVKDGQYHVEVVAGSGISEGRALTCGREELYSTSGEKRYFGKLIGWFYDGIPIDEPRPPTE